MTESFVPYGEILRGRRERLGLSRSQLSMLARVPETTITRIELGHTDSPRAPTRTALDTALDTAEADGVR